MRTFCGIYLAALLLAVSLPAADKTPTDLETVKAERDLERRSGLALEFARRTVERVVEAYRAGDAERGIELLQQIQEAVELSQESLQATGKNASKKPKHFKKAEIETRRLLRDFDGARKALNYDQREDLDAVAERISEINRELLMSIMTKRDE